MQQYELLMQQALQMFHCFQRLQNSTINKINREIFLYVLVNHFLRARYMRNENACKHFFYFFVIRKNVSFHIITKRDSLSRVFINLVVDKKNLYALLFQTKKNIRLRLFSNEVIHENFLNGFLEHPVESIVSLKENSQP